VKREQDFRTGKLLFCVPQQAYFALKTFAAKTTLLEIVDSFYLLFTRDLMGNPLEKSSRLYISSPGLLMGMFAAILIGERVRVTIYIRHPKTNKQAYQKCFSKGRSKNDNEA
jgi:hypothetical protein